jgi:hypothetical protein
MQPTQVAHHNRRARRERHLRGVSSVSSVVSGAIVLTLLLVTTSARAQSLSHLAQPIRQHVSLAAFPDPASVCRELGNGRAKFSFFRQFPDGTLANQAFSVPSGQEFVITDVVWLGKGGGGGFGNFTAIRLFLDVHDRAGEFLDNLYRSAPINLIESGTQVVGGKDQIVAGLRVGPRRVICPTVVNEQRFGTSGSPINDAQLYGYLIPK